MKDLVVLTACKDGEFALRGLLSRPQALNIHRVQVDYLRHPQRDPGCRLSAHELLASQASNYRRALIMFDYEGSGADENFPAEEMETAVESALESHGWTGRCRCIVIYPELENWVWSRSPHVSEVLNWRNQPVPLFEWLAERELIVPGATKPARPKEAMEEALRAAGTPWSSSLFQQLASRVTLRGCTDRAFGRLLETLREWFRP